MKKFEGRTALITGSGRGIGKALALKLASEGARVVVNDVDDAPAAETVAEIRTAGGEAVACVGDITATAFPDRFVQTAVDNFGGIDIIVNNAGYAWDNAIHKATDEMWHAMVDCHMTAPFRILRAAYPVISAAARADAAAGREVFRKIVNVTSNLAGGSPGQIGYSSAKAGLIGMTRTLAREWGRLKVNVNAVAFGHIETRLTAPLAAGQENTVNVAGRDIAMGVHADMLDGLRATIPLGRAGKPKEAAGAIYMLCIPESDYVTGHVVICGGGWNPAL